MKQMCIFLAFCLFALPVFSQKHDYIWIDGLYSPDVENIQNFYFDFTSFPPKIDISSSQMSFWVTNTCMSNAKGELAFYSDGCLVKNAGHMTILGGEGINSGPIHDLNCPYGYNVIHGIFALPLSDTLYNLIHHRSSPWDGICSMKELLTTQINMKANQNLGAVVYEDSVLVAAECLQLACANKHANGRDWWVLVPHHHEDQFYRFLISGEGIRGPWVQNLGNPTRDSFDTCGWSEFSPDGRYFMINACDKGIAVYDFDRCSGLLSNLRHIPGQPFETYPNWSATFSPNSRYLYATADNASRLLQYDLNASNLLASATTAAVWDSSYYNDGGTLIPTLFMFIQHGPDGKLYNWAFNSPIMHLIDFPNRRGEKSKMRQRAIVLPSRQGASNAYYPHYRLGPIDGSACDTLGIDNRPVALFRHEREDTLSPLQVTYTDLSYYEPSTWHWDFGDGTTSADTSPVHVFPASGVYTVCLTASNANASDTYCQAVAVGTIAAPELPALPRVQVYPNPCVDYLTVQQPALLRVTPHFTVTDAFGRCVLDRSLPDFTQYLDVRNLPSGVYVWQYWFGENAVQAGRIVKR